MTHREEIDALGPVSVPAQAHYGAQTARAVANFPISGRTLPIPFHRAMGAIKHAAAFANLALGRLDDRRAHAIGEAADRLIAGELDEHLVVDVFQTGSGTSTNMNVNEVLASVANEALTGARGGRAPVHPNDHVNLGQSSNDVIPTALHVACVVELRNDLRPALSTLADALAAKAAAWHDVVKIGRTHLMDAVPIRLGQEASGWARQARLAVERLDGPEARLCELAIGGTAVGTGLNTHPDFGARVAEQLAGRYRQPFRRAADPFEAQHARDAAAELSAQLAATASGLMKIANDLRWLASGPRCGLGELRLPATQPGSSIMPGKVNPVICESAMMVCAQVMGHGHAVMIANSHGNLELNAMMPVMAWDLLESIRLLANTCRNLVDRAVAGAEADGARAAAYVERSLAMVTALAERIGYDAASALAKRALCEGRTIRELCQAEAVLPAEELEVLLDPARMTEP